MPSTLKLLSVKFLHNLFNQGPLLVAVLLLEAGLALVGHHVTVLLTGYLLAILLAVHILTAHLAVDRAGLPVRCLDAVAYFDLAAGLFECVGPTGSYMQKCQSFNFYIKW